MNFKFLLLFLVFSTLVIRSQNLSNWSLKITPILEDSIQIRAIVINKDKVYFAGHKGNYGDISYKLDDSIIVKPPRYYQIAEDTVAFRAIATTQEYLFLLNIGSPAKIFKIYKSTGEKEIVYIENHPDAFYDSMKFWNEKEGIAIGDPTGDCMSIIITRDGGETWTKQSCKELPKVMEGEAAFAASDSNIAIVNNHCWVLCGGKVSRIYHSADKAKTWEVYPTPLINGTSTTGGYSVDFFDENTGFIIGGDYTIPKSKEKNKVNTNDGGKTWKLVANNKTPNYKSCIQYVPNSNGKVLIAVGFTGISLSDNGGEVWEELSSSSFYTLRFINQKYAIAAGKNSIALLTLQKL